MSLENIVRPFQIRDLTPPRARPIGGTVEADPVVVSFSGSGAAAVWSWSESSSSSSTSESRREISRKTTDKRIENPDDPTQYVIVQQIDEITFRNEGNPKQQSTLYFKND